MILWLNRPQSNTSIDHQSTRNDQLKTDFKPLNRFKPSRKIFYWPLKGGTSFVDLLCFCSVLCLLCLCARLFICALRSPAGKGLTSWLSFVESAVSLSLSHWYPGSGVVLNCIDSWSLHPYLLSPPAQSMQVLTAFLPTLIHDLCLLLYFECEWNWLHLYFIVTFQ